MMVIAKQYQYLPAPQAHIDPRTGSPALRRGTDLHLFPVTDIIQRVAIFPQPAGQGKWLWLDWWQVSGSCAYPDGHRTDWQQHEL
jgi:hypothetical protein